jgi:uncharacterized damage-inducible protein DinB
MEVFIMSTSEVDRILDQLQRAYDGDAWHGPSLSAALDGIDARQAAHRPIANGHTIAEVVRHITSWTREIARRLRSGIARDPEDGDWPEAIVTNDDEWTALLDALDAAQEALTGEIKKLKDADLDVVIGDVRDRALGSGVSRYVSLHGLVQHHAYHGGQISLLRKAAP